MQLEQRPIGKSVPRLASVIRQFRRVVERQHQRDTEILSSVVRALGERGADADAFKAIVRTIIREGGN